MNEEEEAKVTINNEKINVEITAKHRMGFLPIVKTIISKQKRQ